MKTSSHPNWNRRSHHAATAAGIAWLLSLAFLVWTATHSIGDTNVLKTAPRPLQTRPPPSPHSEQFRVALNGRTLIRPPQIEAAIKKTGTAAKLANKFRLHGVASIGGEYVAYLHEPSTGTTPVRVGDSIQVFDISEVTATSVVLSLDGERVRIGK